MDFFHPHPTPKQLFREFESGRISREELQEKMGEHALHIIDEMEEHRRNPIAMMLEQMRNRRTVAKLIRRYDEASVREVLVAQAEQADFPPSNLLWNADHRDVPLYCFVRMKHEPVFRILGLDIHPLAAAVRIEYGLPSARRPLASRSRCAAIRREFSTSTSASSRTDLNPLLNRACG